jgi:NTP pyrophosphatase (non-canonical NTP hydrolase)
VAKNDSTLLDAPKNELPLLASESGEVPEKVRASKKQEKVRIAKKLEDFLIDLGTDPEAKILGLDQFGRPSIYDAFRDVPRNCQRVVTLRVLIVDEPRQ